MLEALKDEGTYNPRKNPSLWLGFILGTGVPIMALVSGAAPWFKVLSLTAPLFWGVILGAAGRVGMNAKQERDIMAGEVRRVVNAQREAEARVGEEQDKRRALESEREDVLSELKLAQAVQATLEPQPIDRPDVEVVGSNIPTRFIGGDYLHTNVVENRWLYLVLLDVSGHGISAALVVARIHGMVRRLTLTKKRPAEMVERLNRAAQRLLQHTYFFITAAIVRMDLATGEAELSTAGHPEQILLRKEGGMELLRTNNRLLGMHDDPMDPDEPSVRVFLEPGDSIVLFTDGLYELLDDKEGQILGEAGLHERIGGLGGLEPQLLIGEVLQELADFQGRSEFDDDVTMLVARYRGRDS